MSLRFLDDNEPQKFIFMTPVLNIFRNVHAVNSICLRQVPCPALLWGAKVDTDMFSGKPLILSKKVIHHLNPGKLFLQSFWRIVGTPGDI
jgi:hypothetical protein